MGCSTTDLRDIYNFSGYPINYRLSFFRAFAILQSHPAGVATPFIYDLRSMGFHVEIYIC